MTNVGTILHKIQTIDLERRKHKKRLQEIANALANHQPVKRAQKQVEQAESALKPLQTALRDLELQAQSTRQKHDSSQQRLYSGTVTNPKELQDIEQNIASLKRRQSELDDKQLELMMEIESAEDTLDAAQKMLQTVMKQAAANNQDLLSEQETIESELVSLAEDRTSLAENLDQESIDLYEGLRPKMAYRPIATLTQERTCSICGVQQTSLHVQQIRQSDELSRCANCNRILITT